MAKPNILFIYSDQHRYDCLKATGHPLLQTPNLDRLANEGVCFDQAYTPSPICVPARCSLLTGQWPTQHGSIHNFDGECFRAFDQSLPTCAAAVSAAGYRSIHVERWHVDPNRTPTDLGFHEYIPGWRYNTWRKNQGIKNAPNDNGWFGQTNTERTPDQSALNWAATQVERSMATCTQHGEPFFIHWHMIEPHLPCRPPEPFASMYDPQDMTPWLGFADDLASKPDVQRQMRLTWGLEGKTWDYWRPIVARYLAEISHLDHQIGRALDYLDASGLAENTLVIYSSDHGDMCGSHGMIDKHMVMYDDIVRVPLLMRWPGVIPAGTRNDDFVSNAIDCAATFCAVAGAPIPETFAGCNLLPAACGTGDNQVSKRTTIFSQCCGNQFGSYT